MEWQSIETCPIDLASYQPRLGEHVCRPITLHDGRRIVVEFHPATHEPQRWLELPR